MRLPSIALLSTGSIGLNSRAIRANREHTVKPLLTRYHTIEIGDLRKWWRLRISGNISVPMSAQKTSPIWPESFPELCPPQPNWAEL
jgi:hypothetical protein